MLWSISSWEDRKNYFKDKCLINSQPTFPIFTSFFDSGKWSYYQKCINQITLNCKSLKLSFTNIQGLFFNVVACESFLLSNSPDIFSLCEINSILIFPSQKTALKWLTSLLRSLTLILTVLLLDFFLLILLFVLQWLSQHCNILIMFLSQYQWMLFKHRWDVPFCHIAYGNSRGDWDNLFDHSWDVPWENVFKLGVAVTTAEFNNWSRWELMYISFTLYIRSYLNHFNGFCCLSSLESVNIICTNRKNLVHLKWSLDRLVIVANGFLKLPNLFMLIK